MIHTIVFAADLSVFTSHITQHLITLAERHRARVIVVHAVEPLGSLGSALVKTYLPEGADDTLQQQAMAPLLANIKERVIDMLAEELLDTQLSFNPIEDVVVAQARPADLVLSVAADRRADLILMGSHGPDVGRDFSLGSVTNRVLQLARVPVYMVPMLPSPPHAGADAGPGQIHR